MYQTTINAIKIWLFSLVSFLGVVVVATKGFREDFSQVQTTTSDIYSALLLVIALIGSIAFIIAVAGFISQQIRGSDVDKKRSFWWHLTYPFKFFFLGAIFPLYLFFYLTQPFKAIKLLVTKGVCNLQRFLSTHRKEVLLRIFGVVLTVTIILPVWAGGYMAAGVIGYEIVNNIVRFQDEPIPITGTGSMYPTFPKGEGKDPAELSKQIVGSPGMQPYPNGIVLFGKKYFGHDIGRFDIVTFTNEKVQAVSQKNYGSGGGFMKRVIGMPGDVLEIRNGLVYLNNEPLKEPYTAKPHSTFGGEFLPECTQITVPSNKVFVMGDNRKGSGDSRHDIGFVDLADVDHVIPFARQTGLYDKRWRDTTNDLSDATKIKIDRESYLELLNQKRQEAGVKPLVYQKKLETAAALRGKVILEYNDFSYEATQSGYTMAQALSDADYWNIIYGEAKTQGYYEAAELLENQLEQTGYTEFLLNPEYQEIGIAEVEGELNGCPAQVVVQHIAGYVPPNYAPDVVESWKTALVRLREIQPGWEQLKTYGEYYEKNKADVDRITQIIAQRISIAEVVVKKMVANQWLSKAEENLIEDDKSLAGEQDGLAERLNNQ